jgi:chaperonin GroES
MKVNFKPLGDRILVKPEVSGELKTKSGLILTDNASRGEKVYGEVISVGAGLFSQTGNRIPLSVNVGDKVMYKKDLGGDKVTLDNEEYLLFHEHELIGVIN